MQGETVTNYGDPANQPIPIGLIATIGASQRCLLVGASVRWAVQSAKKAGYYVIGMDLFGDTDTRAACDAFHLISPQEALAADNLHKTIKVLAAEYSTRPLMVGGLRSTGQGHSTGEASSDRDSNPETLSSLCDGLAISVPLTLNEIPSTSFLSSSKSGRSAAGRWLIKRHQSCGGLGIRFWDEADVESRKTIESGVASLQPFISGRRYGLVAITNGQTTHLLGLTRSLRQRVGVRPFVYSGSLGPYWDSTFPLTPMTELACRVASRYSIKGLFNLDFIRDRRGRWWLLELNARPSGSCEIVEQAAWQSGKLAANQSLMELHINAIEGKSIDWCSSTNWIATSETTLFLKQIVYAQTDGHFQTPSNLDGIADVPAEQTFISNGHPIATSVSRLTGDSGLLWNEMRANTKRLRAMVQPI